MKIDQRFLKSLSSLEESVTPTRFGESAALTRTASRTPDDTQPGLSNTQGMNDITRQELRETLSDIEMRMDKRIDRMERETDRRSDEFRREISLRDEAFIREQAIRDTALDERFHSFLSAQEERDKRLTQQFEVISREVERLGSIKANVWGAMATSIIILLAVGALSLTAFQAGSANQSASEALHSAPALQSPPSTEPPLPTTPPDNT